MAAKIVTFFILCIAFPAYSQTQASLTELVQNLRSSAHETVAVRPLNFEQAAMHKSDAVATVIRGELKNILGDSVYILGPIGTGSVKRVPAILSDPSDAAQQATFRIGDHMQMTGVLTPYNRNALPKTVAAQLKGIDLSAYNGEPVMIVTRLVSSAPPPEAPGTPHAAPSGRPQPDEIEPAASPTASPTSPSDTAPRETPQAPPASVPTIIVEPVPLHAPDFVTDPANIVESPDRYYGRTLVFDALTDDTPDEYLVHLIFDDDSPDTYLLGVRTNPTPVLDPGTRVRVSGRLTTLPLAEIEERAGIAIANILWADEEDVPKFLVDSLDIVTTGRINNMPH